MEQWRKIADYANYEVSDCGRVRNAKTMRVLKPHDNGYGYLTVGLCQHGKQRTLRVHRLVFVAFVGGVPEGMEINHIDEDKHNNRLENLEVITHADNMAYGMRGRRQSNTMRKLVGRPITQYNLDGTIVCVHNSIAEAIERGYRGSSIVSCCRGRLKTSQGYKWEYAC